MARSSIDRGLKELRDYSSARGAASSPTLARINRKGRDVVITTSGRTRAPTRQERTKLSNARARKSPTLRRINQKGAPRVITTSGRTRNLNAKESADLSKARLRRIDPTLEADLKAIKASGKEHRSAGMNALAGTVGAFRAVGNTAIGLGRNLNPVTPRRTLSTLGKSVGQAKEAAVGLGGLLAVVGEAASLPVTVPVSLASGDGFKPVSDLGKSGSSIGSGIAKSVSKDHGASFRGEKGATKKRVKQIKDEGAFNAAADLAALGGGQSALLGSAARKAAKGGSAGATVRKVAAATEARPGLRTSAKGDARGQKISKGVVGAGARVAVDKTRGRVQASRVREAETGQVGPVRGALKKPARGLPLHRQALKPGEVVPVFDRTAALKQRRRTATDEARANQKASTVSKRVVVGAKGGNDGPLAGVTVRNATKDLSDPEAVAATYSAMLGITGAAAGKKAIERRIKQVEADVERIRTEGAMSGAAQAPEVLQELPNLKALLKTPELFDLPQVQAARVAITGAGAAVREGRGLTKDAARAANAKLQARHIGAEPMRESQPARRVVDSTEASNARKAADSNLARAERAHNASRAVLAKATGRAEVLSRNVGGVGAEKKLAGGGQGVREAEKTLGATRTALLNARAGAKEAAKLEKAAKRGDVLPPVVGETTKEFADRIEAQAFKEHGLAPSGYLPSRFNEAAEEISSSGSTGAKGIGSKKREGTVFELGAQVTGHAAIRNLETALNSRLTKFERAGAVSDTLEREGLPFKTAEDAAAWIRHNKVEDVAILDGRAHGNIVRADASTAGLNAKGQRGDLGDGFAPTGAVYVVPKAVESELTQLATPPGQVGVAFDKLKVATSVALLGLNPTWPIFQTISDVSLAAAAGVTPRDVARAYRLRKGMTDAQRDSLSLLSGNSGISDILKSSDALTGSAAILHSSPMYRKFFEGKRPLTALIRLDAARTGLFRDATVMKKAARMDANINAVRPIQDRLTSALSAQTPDSMAKLLAGPDAVKAAEHMTKIMGDFTSYTAAERKYLRRSLPFYGFLRYSTRLALYTLPVEHPAVGLLLAEIGKGSAEEQKSILGPGYELYQLGKLHDKNGDVSDFSRANPLGNAIFGSNNVLQSSAGFLPPAVVVLDNARRGQSSFLGGSSYTFGGDQAPVDPRELTGSQRAKIALSEGLKLLPPVRIGGKILNSDPRSTGDDFGVFGGSKLQPGSAASALRLDERRQLMRKGGALGRAQEELLPIAKSRTRSNDIKNARRSATIQLEKRQAAELKAAKMAHRKTPLGKIDFKLEQLDAKLKAAGAPDPASPLGKLEHKLDLLDAKLGGR